jgi:hypothetical protein
VSRVVLLIGGIALWLLCYTVAMLTIIPLSAMGLAAIFSSSFTAIERLQGLGFLLLGLIIIATLSFALTRISRLFTKASHAPNQ